MPPIKEHCRRRHRRPTTTYPPSDDDDDSHDDDIDLDDDEVAELLAKEERRQAVRRAASARYRARHPERVAPPRNDAIGLNIQRKWPPRDGAIGRSIGRSILRPRDDTIPRMWNSAGTMKDNAANRNTKRRGGRNIERKCERPPP